MGLDLHAYNFLKYLTRNNECLGDTLTLGRQEDHYGWINPENGLKEKYCEKILIKEFDALNVESVDVSNYEKATFVQDLNKIWTCKDLLRKKYRSILDFGTLEHVFNLPQALESIAKSCEIGGQIIHVQLHSDFCGHGFYQFSAELFYSWYSKENGFDDLEIFIAPYCSPNIWYRCLKPERGERCELSGRSVPNSYILVKARKNKEVDNRQCIQSDYSYNWTNNKEAYLPNRETSFLSKIKQLFPYQLKCQIKSKLYKFRIFPWWRSKYLVKENLNDLLSNKLDYRS